MSNSRIIPEIYWVVGDQTDSGKTTIATALIRALNQIGIPTVGFKPVAAIRLQQQIDFIFENYPKHNSRLFGSDSLELSKASPLTDESLLEVVVPTHFLCYSNWLSTVLIRNGSGILNDAEFYTPSDTIDFYQREDIQKLVARIHLPISKAKICNGINARNFHLLPGEKQAKAFNYLVGLNPNAVVCEGAGSQLPVWAGCPVANHLVLIAGGWINFFPGINIKVQIDNSTATLPNLETLAPLLKNAVNGCVSSPLELVAKEIRDEATENLVHKLLGRAGKR